MLTEMIPAEYIVSMVQQCDRGNVPSYNDSSCSHVTVGQFVLGVIPSGLILLYLSLEDEIWMDAI